MASTFDERKWQAAVKRQRTRNTAQDAPPKAQIEVICYVCWKCDEERLTNTFFVQDSAALNYHAIRCPRCGNRDKIEPVGRGMAEITWQRS